MGTKINTQQEASCCVVISAGEIADYAGVRARIPPGSFVLCADGGLRHCKGLHLTADLLVGDFDSLGRPPPGIPTVTLPPDKNYTDTDHAVEEAVGRGYRRLLLCGALGGRADHTIANLQTLARCAAQGLEAQITDGVTDIYALSARGERRELWLEPRAGHYFSLLSMVDACAGVTIRGGRYPLEHYPLSSLEARAVSNEFTGEPVCISMEEGVLVVVVTPMD